MEGSVGEIRAFRSHFAPQGWMFCNGQSLPASSHQELFSVLGYKYGGSGNIFKLPKIAENCQLKELSIETRGINSTLDNPHPLNYCICIDSD